MIKSFWGFKVGQSQIFDKAGKRVPATRVVVKPLLVTQIKTKKNDGYQAIQVGVGNIKIKNIKKPIKGHLKKTGTDKTAPFLFKEIRADGEVTVKPGDCLRVGSVLGEGDVVAVSGFGKGKGFAGVMKRWGFAGGPRTHGQSDRQRAPGSIGQTTTPGRVFKGKKMAGRMGGMRKTVKGLKIIKLDIDNEELLVSGLVPGAKGGLLEIRVQEKGKETKDKEDKRESDEKADENLTRGGGKSEEDIKNTGEQKVGTDGEKEDLKKNESESRQNAGESGGKGE